MLTFPDPSAIILLALRHRYIADGGIAQLGERLNGIQEVSGSIPLISTKRNSHPKGWLFSFGTGGAESNPDDACKIDEIVYSGVDGSDYQSNDTVNQDAGHKV